MPHQLDKRVVHLTIIEKLSSDLIQKFISSLDWFCIGASGGWLRTAHVLGFEGMRTRLVYVKTGWKNNLAPTADGSSAGGAVGSRKDMTVKRKRNLSLGHMNGHI